jgi:hypothetical protein
MKNNFTIFYSWQSDIKRNRNFIQTCIEKAIKEIKQKLPNEIELEINIDRDTTNNSGSPEIANTIFEKIKNCDIFVSDVTIINKTLLSSLMKHRLTPNPNVLIELGYAVNLIGWQRVICINDTKFSLIEDLPFDIRGHRITTFKSSDKKAKEELILILKKAFQSIINNYDNIIAEQLKASNKFHDLNIYKQITKICNETTLTYSISLCVNSLFVNQVYLDNWNDLQRFYQLSINLFLDKELDDLMKCFLKELDEFDTIVITYFKLNDSNKSYLENLAKKVNGELVSDDDIYDYKQSKKYIPHKEPFRNESWEDADKRIYKLINTLDQQGEKVKISFKTLTLKIKEKLM